MLQARYPVALLPAGEAEILRRSCSGKFSKTLRVEVPTSICSASASFQTLSAKMPEIIPRSIPPLGSLKAVLFDVDGTLCDSDPLHYAAFRDMLQEIGYNGGVPITEEFFVKYISGRFNPDIGRFLFPEWEVAAQTKFTEDKEAYFRRMAANQLEAHKGLHKFCEWLKKKNIRRAAVTNAPRLNAEQMIAGIGLGDFFEHLVIGSECTRAKPFPDPYLTGLTALGLPADQAFVFEDSPAGIKAAVAAELAVVGILAGNPRASLLEAGASFVIESFDDPALWKALGEEDSSQREL
ncbi:phosphoglycolate phosphatase [Marchantia polymorpha subsp. ruderalis]